MMYTIYKITNQTNKKFYVGFTSRPLQKRWREHLSLSRRGSRQHLHRAMRKNAPSVFDLCVLEEGKNLDFGKNFREPYWISVLEPEYNMTNGGDGLLGYKSSPSQKHKRSMLSMGEQNSFYGKKHTRETKTVIGMKSKERNHSDESKRKCSLSVTEAKAQNWVVFSPVGRVFSVKNLKVFCREKSIPYGNLCSVSRGERTHTHGWKAKRA